MQQSERRGDFRVGTELQEADLEVAVLALQGDHVVAEGGQGVLVHLDLHRLAFLVRVELVAELLLAVAGGLQLLRIQLLAPRVLRRRE